MITLLPLSLSVSLSSSLAQNTKLNRHQPPIQVEIPFNLCTFNFLKSPEFHFNIIDKFFY